MKKRIAIQFTAVISALLLFVSCARQNTGEASSVLTQSDKQNIISSGVSKEETSSDIASLDAQTSSQEKNENNESKNTESKKSESKKPEKEETNSNKPVSSAESTSSNMGVSQEYVPQRFRFSIAKYEEVLACIEKNDFTSETDQYFGTYNQYDVMLIAEKDKLTQTDTKKVRISEYEFEIRKSEELVLYKNNSYILLSDAYNQGLVIAGNIKNIYYLYKEYCEPDTRTDFEDNSVLVCIRKEHSIPGRVYTEADFPTISISKIEILSPSRNYGKDSELLMITLPVRSHKNVWDVIEELQKLDIVLFAEPNYFVSPC